MNYVINSKDVIFLIIYIIIIIFIINKNKRKSAKNNLKKYKRSIIIFSVILITFSGFFLPYSIESKPNSFLNIIESGLPLKYIRRNILPSENMYSQKIGKVSIFDISKIQFHIDVYIFNIFFLYLIIKEFLTYLFYFVNKIKEDNIFSD